jgi:hypothetical protein
VKVNRRGTFTILAGLMMTRALDRADAQQQAAFDPVAFAKLRAGEIAREISESPRDPSGPEPPRDAVFETGLLLQAGLRALLPVPERDGVALPGKASPRDPPALVEAQENYTTVFQSGRTATPEQTAIAVRAINSAARQLGQAGFEQFSRGVIEWLHTSGLAE